MFSSDCAGCHHNISLQQGQTPDSVITASLGSCAFSMSSPAELDHVLGGNIQGVISGSQSFEGLFRDGAVWMVGVEKAQQDVGIELNGRFLPASAVDRISADYFIQ
jgi:hypothetical protein